VDSGNSYLYFSADLHGSASFHDGALQATTERHRIKLHPPPLVTVVDDSGELFLSCDKGVVLEMSSGLLSPAQLNLLEGTLKSGRRAWLYWPAEEAIECVDDERLRSLEWYGTAVKWMKWVGDPVDRAMTIWRRVPGGLRWIYRGEFPVRRSDVFSKLEFLSVRAQPVPLDGPIGIDGHERIPGLGLYVRTDFWAASHDQTTAVLTELAETTDRLVCLTPRPRRNEDQEPGGNTDRHPPSVQHIVMDGPNNTTGEDAIVLAPAHYMPIVRATCQALRPAFLYERLCAGESVCAELSQLLRIPYIVEYSGSPALLQEAINGSLPFYQEIYAKAEELALRQASAIVVASPSIKDDLTSRGINASRVLVHTSSTGGDTGDARLGGRLARLLASVQTTKAEPTAEILTGDGYKDQVQTQWNTNPVGSHYARESQPHTREWFLEIERHRYGVYAPWMPRMMEFADHAGQDVLEIGGGIGTDLAQFAAHGASVTDVDLSAGHLRLAEENFGLRGLQGRFIQHDAEALPFPDRSFDLVYSNGVLHHTPNTAAVVSEIWRVLRPMGRAIVMIYAERSLHFWRKLVWELGVKERRLDEMSIGEIMSQSVERSANDARPLVKVYTSSRVRALFKEFASIEIFQRQLTSEEFPKWLRWTLPKAETLLGWNLIVKATKR
jgi:ubiquinone/menaquinone biosynthesis C-methylase UbiE